MRSTKAVLAQPCIRCAKSGAFPCPDCHQFWYCSKACKAQHYAHGHAGQCKLLRDQGKTSSTQIESTPEQNEECLKPLLRKPSRVLFDPGRVQKLLAFRPKLASDDAIPSGLMNNGTNTCFANAVLQCLVNTQPLQVFLTSAEHSKEKCPLTLSKGNVIGLKHNFCVICHLKDIVNLMLDPKYSAILPRDLLLNLDKLGEFQLGAQEDAHQFLLDLLFKFHDSFVYVDSITRKLNGAQNAKKAGNTSTAGDYVDGLDRQLVEETSLVYQMFGGKFLHKTRCIECGKVTMNPEPFLVLSLGLADGASLEESLRNFCKIEVLPKTDESLVCDTCQRRVMVQRQTTFWQAPEILIVHLKRFDNMGRKINKSVAFSPTIDFSDVISRDSPYATQEPTTYSLYAMITHYGNNIMTGHYVSFVFLDGKWYLYDDAKVYGIVPAIVMKQNAYILLYKKNTPAIPAAPSSSLRASGPASSNSTSSPLSTSSDSAIQATTNALSTLALSRLTPPFTVYLGQSDDIMNDITIRIHLPQLESLRLADISVSLTSSGRFKFTSPVYYLLLEIVFPLEAAQAKCTYYEQDRTLVVFVPIAQEPQDENQLHLLPSTINSEQMSEDNHTFNETDKLDVDPIVGEEETKSAEEERVKKGQAKIEALNLESATYGELYDNIRELQRNPDRMAQGSAPAPTGLPTATGANSSRPASGPTPGAAKKRVKPNEPCPCGSGKKYKVCHGKP